MSDKENLIDDDLAGEPIQENVSDAAQLLVNKDAERERLQADVDAFLARGGEINRVDSAMIADAPKKPEVKYGGQPI